MHPRDIKVLVTAVCGDMGSSVARALHAKGYQVFGVDACAPCPVLHVLHNFEQVPFVIEHVKYKIALEIICKKYSIDVLLPLSEQEILFLSNHIDDFSHLPLKFALHRPEVLRIFFDKLATADFFDSISYKAPTTVNLHSYSNQFPYPFIAKPRSGRGSQNVFVVKDKALLSFLLSDRDTQYVAQEYVGTASEEYTTGVFFDGTICSTITFKRTLGYGGLSQVVYLVNEPFLHEMACTIMRKLQIIGCINIQTRKVGKTFIPFEVNPRISSTAMFRQIFNFPDVHWWIQRLFGELHTPQPLPFGAIGVRRMDETVFYKNDHALTHTHREREREREARIVPKTCSSV